MSLEGTLLRIFHFAKKNGKSLKRIGSLLSISSIIYIAFFLFELVKESEIKHISLFLLYVMGLITFISAINVYINAYSYGLILNLTHKKNVNYNEVVKIYTRSNIYKYLPGNILHYVSRNIISSKYELDHKKTLWSTLTEIILIIAVSFIFVLLLFFISNIEIYIVSSVLFILLLLLLKFKLAKPACVFLFVIIINNLGFVFMLNIYRNYSYFDDVVQIGVIQTVSWLAGYLTPGAPGGLGIKEYVLMKLSNPGMINSITVIAVFHRIIFVLGDLLAVVFLETYQFIFKAQRS